MGLDIRLPIGLMFAILGVLLLGYGFLGDPTIYQRSLGININIWWGVAMLVFGGIMITLGQRGTSAMQSAEQSPEGRIIEELEHLTGKESDPAPRGH